MNMTKLHQILLMTTAVLGFVLPNVAIAKVSKNQRDLVIVTHLDLNQSDMKGKKSSKKGAKHKKKK